MRKSVAMFEKKFIKMNKMRLAGENGVKRGTMEYFHKAYIQKVDKSMEIFKCFLKGWVHYFKKDTYRNTPTI
jgi:hypothetical protein